MEGEDVTGTGGALSSGLDAAVFGSLHSRDCQSLFPGDSAGVLCQSRKVLFGGLTCTRAEISAFQ
jgi:hypothetical protein